MKQIRRFGIAQTAKVAAVCYSVLAAIIFVPLGVISLVAGRPRAVWVVLFPVLYGVLGYVVVALSCWIYNMIAGKVGGIAVELAEGPG